MICFGKPSEEGFLSITGGDEMEWTALSPWAEIDGSEMTGLTPRLETLEGKTIGMFGDFMISATYMLKSVERELRKQYPTAKFSYLMYEAETKEIAKDRQFYPRFRKWLSGVDCVISFFGSVPSSALYLGYNSAYMEKLDKPTVMALAPRTAPAGLRGIKAKGVPALRTVEIEPVLGIFSEDNEVDALAKMEPYAPKLTGDIIDALTRPLTEAERDKPAVDQSLATNTYTGTAQEISRLFYSYGWTNGQPIEIPTREAVDEMLRGTDLPAGYVVGYLPPKMGVATVEKIAVNAVMAGCLPTYLPVLIAAVRAALDERICLEGWTCSQSTWGPVLTVSGRISEEIGLNTGDNALSPYYKANAALARAWGYLMMNIAGLRPGIEDLSEMGHENRMGLCIGDSVQNNPWGPLHTDFGLSGEDSAVTIFWPQNHQAITARSIPGFLEELCKINPYGWDPGMEIIFTPKAAELFAAAGWNRRRIIDYIVEYARRPASEVDLSWLKGNSHPVDSVDFPEVMTHSTRIFWTSDHMFAIVAGGHAGPMITVLGGGGDHGGPACAKVELPECWDELVEAYRPLTRPNYVAY